MGFYNTFEVVRYEGQAVLDRARESRAGKVVTAAGQKVSTASSGAARTAGADQAIGKLARGFRAYVVKLPLMTLAPDAIVRGYAVDLLTGDVKRDPGDALRHVQLAEAIMAAATLRGLVAVGRVVDPVSFVMGLSMRLASGLDREDGELSSVQRLARRAHRLVLLRGGPSTTEDYTVLARVYRVVGKPGLASRYAALAIEVGERELARHPQPASAWQRARSALSKRGLSGFVEELGEAVDDFEDRWESRFDGRFEGDFGGLSAHDRARMELGSAWVAAGWIAHDLGHPADAHFAARRALDHRMSVGHEVLAATEGLGGGIWKRSLHRKKILDKAKPIDRSYYRGRWRGSITTSGSTAARQVEKLNTMFR